MKIVAVKENGELKIETPICAKCKHLHKSGPELRWYWMFCKKHPLPKSTDPVTGEIGFASYNDSGKKIIIEDPYDYCINYNKGDCRDYNKL